MRPEADVAPACGIGLTRDSPQNMSCGVPWPAIGFNAGRLGPRGDNKQQKPSASRACVRVAMHALRCIQGVNPRLSKVSVNAPVRAVLVGWDGMDAWISPCISLHQSNKNVTAGLGLRYKLIFSAVKFPPSQLAVS
jgi:hypothetical protein